MPVPGTADHFNFFSGWRGGPQGSAAYAAEEQRRAREAGNVPVTPAQEPTGPPAATPAVSGQPTPGGGADGLVAPVTGTFVGGPSSHYGAARRGGRRPHSGTDMQADDGSRAVAMIDGVVTFSGYQSGYGGTIVVKGADGIYRRYAVHGEPLVGRGQQVRQGQPIGIIAKGHLHYEEVHPTLPDGRPNPVFQEFEKNGNANTSYQRGTTNPATALGLRHGTAITAGQPLDPQANQAAQERAAKKAEDAERLYKEWRDLEKPEETPIPKRSRAGGINLKINVRGPRGVKVASESSGALSGATISREMDPSGGIVGHSPG